ncbi:M23 family metallopeptidase [Streptomyces sp. NPDC059582]|uniref:M23 family metallopeptidase n=1 Tax=Streptomyces sp. NPDC059582 TaxID=3346875 RepID=UPI00368BD86B
MPVSCAHETCRRLSCPRTAGYSHRTALAAPVVEAKEKLVNDRHPSGTMTTPAPASDAAAAHYAPYGTEEAQYGDFTTYGVGYDANGFGTGSFDTGAHATAAFASDPLFGDLPGNSHDFGSHDLGSYDSGTAYATGAYDGGHGAGHGTGHETGAYDASQWSTDAHQTLNYDPYAAQHHAAYDTGAYETTAWSAEHQQLSTVPPQATASDASGEWDTNTWVQADAPEALADPTQQWEWGTQAFDTGAYDATQWNTDGDESPAPDGEPAEAADESDSTGELPAVAPLLDDQEEIAPVPAPRAASRSRRRPPPKRSALLTVAVPSVCVMGVAGIAAASVGTMTDDGKETTASASDAQAVKPSAANNKLDVQLESLSAGADDFRDRASRTQERIDLKAQQVAEKKRAAAEAARKERLRPKYALPVEQQGLSAYFGQAGVNWMSVHTGIDFPVSYGTSVMSATDGTVRTQWNSAYGNMMIVTAMDGTETWYCHLSTYRVASGTTVKAGDPIAYSGNSGNSTGPHLHFEVRPSGGSAIDPLPWLRSHGLDPT